MGNLRTFLFIGLLSIYSTVRPTIVFGQAGTINAKINWLNAKMKEANEVLHNQGYEKSVSEIKRGVFFRRIVHLVMPPSGVVQMTNNDLRANLHFLNPKRFDIVHRDRFFYIKGFVIDDEKKIILYSYRRDGHLEKSEYFPSFLVGPFLTKTTSEAEVLKTWGAIVNAYGGTSLLYEPE